MASFEELQARALARTTTRDTPEITMDGTESQLAANQRDDSFDDGELHNSTDAAPPRSLTTNTVAQLIRHYNLPEGTIADVERFQQLPPSMQLVHIYLALQGVRSLFVTEPRPQTDGRWQTTASFEKNVKTFTKAVFFQATVKNYNSPTIIGYMETIIKRLRWGLPEGSENDPDLWKDVVRVIRDRASDLRSEWKKMILESMENHNPINKLARSLTSSMENLTPDGPFLIRIAVLVHVPLPTSTIFQFVHIALQRTVAARDSSQSYWRSVASELENIQNSEQPRQILAEYYLEDQKKYPRPGMSVLDADFVPVLSGGSIIEAAGEALS